MIILGYIAIIAFPLFILLCLRKIYAFLTEYYRFSTLGDQLFGRPALPLLGNILQAPRNSFAFSEFWIDEANIALANGKTMLRTWLLGQLSVIICDGNTAKVILESSTETKKGRNYNFLHQWLGNGLLLSYDAEWRSQRKMLTPIFHFSMLEQYTKVFNKQAKVLLERFDELANEDGEVNLYPYIIRCTLDIVGEAVMGTDIGAQREEINEYRMAVQRFNELTYKYSISPQYWFKPIYYLFGNGRETDAVVRSLKAMSQEVIDNGLKRIKARDSSEIEDRPNNDGKTDTSNKRSNKAFVDLLLEMYLNGEMSMEQVQEHIDTFILAGHDTTAHSVSWALWCMATHPKIQARVYEEVREHCDLNNQANDDLEFKSDELNQLKYTEACIKEAMRVFPPVPLLERRLRNDVVIDGKIVPRGTDVLISPLVIHHNHKVWGADHDSYNPDNFFVKEIAERRTTYDYIPFSAGPRNCIGYA